MSSVLTAAVWTIVATSAAAQDSTGVGAIAGVVVRAAGQPAEGVRVCALDTASCATSDARGACRIREPRVGACRLEVVPLAGLLAQRHGFRLATHLWIARRGAAPPPHVLLESW